MTSPWSPERVVSAALARSLVEAQFPALAPADVEPFGAGWDNTAYRVNRSHVFRFPRRQVAVPLLITETRLLPAIAPHLPLPVPNPTFIGRASPPYLWPFAGYPMLPGRTACGAGLTEDRRIAAAEPLGEFLKALHAIPPAEAVRHGAGPDPISRLDVAGRRPKAHELLHRLAARGLIADPHPLAAALDDAPAGHAVRADTLVHGDLYARHLLVDEAGRLAGVIDWGDVHLGDPASDLAAAHLLLPSAAHEAFRRAYGSVAETTWALARFRAVWHALHVLEYGTDAGDPDLVRAADYALARMAGL